MNEGCWIMVERGPVPMKSWPRRVGWLIMIWTAGVITLAVVAVFFRILMNAAGLTE
jgi:hypothetical protein